MDKTPEKTLAWNLRWLMDNSGHDSQAKAAAKARIDQKTVGRILNGTNFPTLDKLTALGNAFGVEAWQLLAPRLGVELYKIDADRRIVPIRESGPPPTPPGGLKLAASFQDHGKEAPGEAAARKQVSSSRTARKKSGSDTNQRAPKPRDGGGP